jgi:hypothetical protein
MSLPPEESEELHSHCFSFVLIPRVTVASPVRYRLKLIGVRDSVMMMEVPVHSENETVVKLKRLNWDILEYSSLPNSLPAVIVKAGNKTESLAKLLSNASGNLEAISTKLFEVIQGAADKLCPLSYEGLELLVQNYNAKSNTTCYSRIIFSSQSYSFFETCRTTLLRQTIESKLSSFVANYVAYPDISILFREIVPQWSGTQI